MGLRQFSFVIYKDKHQIDIYVTSFQAITVWKEFTFLKNFFLVTLWALRSSIPRISFPKFKPNQYCGIQLVKNTRTNLLMAALG
jgi:hypothetical protein